MKQGFSQLAARIVPSLMRWSLKHGRRLVISLILLQVAVVAVAAWQIRRHAHRELDAARVEVERQALVPFEKRVVPGVSSEGVTLIQSEKATRGLARLNDSYFAATDGGLVELSLDGKVKRRLTVLEGLPESDLTALAVWRSQLFIGTRSQGLAVLDGARFTAYRWTDRKAQTVTALLEDRGRLLIGTLSGGLLEFDGKLFREIKAGAEQKRLAGIERLTADGARLFIGTFADGLWVREAGRWQHFTVADGLPSNRVVGVATKGNQVLVATDFGVAAASTDQLFDAAGSQSQKSFKLLATLPSLSSIARYGDSILLSKDNGEIFQLVADTRLHRFQLVQSFWPPAEGLSSCQLHAFSGEPSLWLLSNEGIRRTSWRDERPSGKALPGRLSFAEFSETATGRERTLADARSLPAAAQTQLTSNLISALAFDDLGNLWVGSFRNGIDVFTREGRRLTHLESDVIREINSLVWDGASKRMMAATSQGLVRFTSAMQPQVFSAADGLLSNSVLHVAAFQVSSSASSANAPVGPAANRAAIVLATSRGLMFGQAGQWRALTSVQGLPSNSVYTVLPHRESIYAGTLNGLAQITDGRIVRVFNDSNSKLAHNWVTALCAAGGRLFVGSYGGGVFELTSAGELASFAAEIGKQTVNPNAMVSDGERLYVGTLDGAWVLELDSQKWSRLKNELPSATVLSVTSDDEHVYFGTTSGLARINKKRLEFVRE